MKYLAALAVAAVAYVLAAWLVAPGFFDGFAPAAPYHWVSPPPDLRNGNQAPSSGRTTIAVQNGASQAGHLYTTDQQASVTYPSQSFAAPPAGAQLLLEIQPVASYPDLGGIGGAGNVYLVSVTTRLISPVVVTLRYGSQQSGPPTAIFAAETPTSPWKSLGSINSAVPYTVSASTTTLGYFVVGFPPAPASTPPPAQAGGGPPVVLIVAVAAAALAVLAGVPFMVARRGAAGPEPAADADTPQAAGQNRGGARRRRRRGRR
ncbi:MAG TPA: hypothetical protein VE953_05930 [Terriglobales bacterium]|nr:hypothetical protein [Terriglobales bacterium]